QIHLTLRFIGDADEAMQREIEAALELIEVPAFTLAIRGTGQFPKNRAARVLWAGVDPEAPLVALARKVDEAVVAAGVAPEDRDFSPHVTLARIKDTPSKPAIERFLKEHAALQSPPFAIEEIRLYSSVLSSKGAVHTVEKSFPLK